MHSKPKRNANQSALSDRYARTPPRGAVGSNPRCSWLHATPYPRLQKQAPMHTNPFTGLSHLSFKRNFVYPQHYLQSSPRRPQLDPQLCLHQYASATYLSAPFPAAAAKARACVRYSTCTDCIASGLGGPCAGVGGRISCGDYVAGEIFGGSNLRHHWESQS